MSQLDNLVVDLPDGWLRAVRRVESPNADCRPADVDVELIVVHSISLPPGEFGGPAIDELFCNRLDSATHPYYCEIANLKVSAHTLIRRDGSITQYVPFHLRAWHAGESSYQGRDACNDFSVGIELEGCDRSSYDDAQYRSLGQLILALRRAYPTLATAPVVGHDDIAPGRKTDPGPTFNWQRLTDMISHSDSRPRLV
ncbi:MAG: 1,6-anhydro-N-acetylmuramyl-L-alanine amidase AmpD [Gammaproteobacteria bacterium]